MNLTEIARARLYSQQIEAPRFESSKDIVGWMGAIQAQDFEMAKWALGVRIPGVSLQTVEAAITRGEVLRTHVLRPTWHLVAAEDLRWMLALSAQRIKNSFKARNQQLELSQDVFLKSNRLIEKALRDGRHCTRDELLAVLAQAGISLDSNRASHILVQAEMEGLICSGPMQAGKPTYALLEEWVPKQNPLTHEEALAALATKYFTSRSPATLQDFGWWSGLPLGEARRAGDLVRSAFQQETSASQTYWLPDSFRMPAVGGDSFCLLPAYDELLISYRDRSALLPPGDQTKVVSQNGLFRPILVENGRIVGVWKRTFKKEKVVLEAQPFAASSPALREAIRHAAAQYGRFLGKPTELIFTPFAE
jgi:hypothetical protein